MNSGAPVTGLAPPELRRRAKERHRDHHLPEKFAYPVQQHYSNPCRSSHAFEGDPSTHIGPRMIFWATKDVRVVQSLGYHTKNCRPDQTRSGRQGLLLEAVKQLGSAQNAHAHNTAAQQ
jgi:hypothetical protein